MGSWHIFNIEESNCATYTLHNKHPQKAKSGSAKYCNNNKKYSCHIFCHDGSVQGNFLVQSESHLLSDKVNNNKNLLEGINGGIALLLNVILCTYDYILDDKAYVSLSA